MMMQWTRRAAAMLLVVIVAACSSTPSGMAHREPVKIIPGSERFGSDPALKAPGVWLLNSDKDVARTGSTQLQRMRVDFSKYSLIVLAVGEQKTTGYWALITGAQVQDSTLFVQGVANMPASDSKPEMMATFAYATVEIPKLDGKYMVALEVTSEKGMSPPAMMHGAMMSR